MGAKFELDVKDWEDFNARLQLLMGKSEDVINDALLYDGVQIMTDDVTRFIPRSRRSKGHARDEDWSKAITYNLGFTVISKGGAASNKNSFGYLIFPDEGRGVKNNHAHDFSGKGSAVATPKIMDILNIAISKAIEEVIYK